MPEFDAEIDTKVVSLMLFDECRYFVASSCSVAHKRELALSDDAFSFDWNVHVSGARFRIFGGEGSRIHTPPPLPRH